MKPKFLLSIASVIIVLHAVGHSFGMAGWTEAETDEQKMVVHAMSDHRFSFMGAVHSFADSFNGFGWIGEVSLLLVAYLLWFTGSIGVPQPQISRKLSAALFISLLLQSVMEFKYFFPAAYIMTFIAALLTGISFLLTKKV